MKQSIIDRREAAKQRFRIMTYRQWSTAQLDRTTKPNTSEDAYQGYLERKQIEARSLGIRERDYEQYSGV